MQQERNGIAWYGKYVQKFYFLFTAIHKPNFAILLTNSFQQEVLLSYVYQRILFKEIYTRSYVQANRAEGFLTCEGNSRMSLKLFDTVYNCPNGEIILVPLVCNGIHDCQDVNNPDFKSEEDECTCNTFQRYCKYTRNKSECLLVHLYITDQEMETA